MSILIVMLIIIIFLILCYLFLIKKELERISKEIKFIKNSDSNMLIHSKVSSKALSLVINEINELLLNIKEEKINLSHNNVKIQKMMMNISHDLRTPLTSALGYIDIVLNSDLSLDEKTQKLKIINERLRRLEELINSFFEFSKVISSNESLLLENVNMIAILEECIAHYYEDYTEDNRKIILKTSINKLKIKANKVLLARIFDNLINNAYKHSCKDLIVKVIVTDKIKISFINDLLYPNLDIDKMFDEFYTIDISRTKGNTGLGLAIVKEFTEQMNGKIYAIKDNDLLEIVLEFNYDN